MAGKRFSTSLFKSAIMRGSMQLLPSIFKKMMEMLKQGVPPGTAAEAAGVTSLAFTKWYAKGEKIAQHVLDNQEYPRDATNEDIMCFELHEAVNHHVAKATVDAIKSIHKARKRDWKAAAWWLERRSPEFGRPAAITVTPTGGGGPGTSTPSIIFTFPDNGRGPARNADT